MQFTIAPDRGAVALFVGCELRGHRLVSLKRKGTKVEVLYEKLSRKKAGQPQ